jgi:hypothetical protein
MPEAQSTPFKIAVTGHRDLRPNDLPALRREVGAVFDSLREQMPGRRLMLLSALAEGADQLVAEVAREHGVQLAAVLPMPLDIYRDTMPPEQQQRLDSLYARADLRITLPLEDRTPDQVRDSEDARAASYESLAHYLVGNSQALIALWDGKPSDKAGGTCRVVDNARFGKTPGSGQLVESHCEAVYHVITPRLSNGDVADEVRTIKLDCNPARESA